MTITAKTVAGRRSRLRVDGAPNGRYVIGGTLGISAGARRITRAANDPRAILQAAWGAALADAGIEWQPASGLSAPGLASNAVLAWPLAIFLAELVPSAVFLMQNQRFDLRVHGAVEIAIVVGILAWYGLTKISVGPPTSAAMRRVSAAEVGGATLSDPT